MGLQELLYFHGKLSDNWGGEEMQFYYLFNVFGSVGECWIVLLGIK